MYIIVLLKLFTEYKCNILIYSVSKVPKDKVKPAVTEGTKTIIASHIVMFGDKSNFLIFNAKKFALSVEQFPSVCCNYMTSIVTNKHLLIAFPPWWPSIVEKKAQTSEERYISGASAEAVIHLISVGLWMQWSCHKM